MGNATDLLTATEVCDNRMECNVTSENCGICGTPIQIVKMYTKRSPIWRCDLSVCTQHKNNMCNNPAVHLRVVYP